MSVSTAPDPPDHHNIERVVVVSDVLILELEQAGWRCVRVSSMVITMMLLPRVGIGDAWRTRLETSSSAVLVLGWDRRWPDLLGAALHAAAALDQLAEVYRDRPVAGGRKLLAQLAGTGRDENMQPVADHVESECVRIMLVRNERIGKQRQPAADGFAD